MCERRGRGRWRSGVAWAVVWALTFGVLSARAIDDVDEISVFDALDGSQYGPGAQIVVKARIKTRRVMRLQRARLFCKVGYGGERETAMLDDGRWPDESAGDGIYSARCDTGGTRVGDMVRWRVQVDDPYMTAPWPGNDKEGAEYYGVALLNGFSIDSKLPVLHWYTPDSWKMTTDAGARVSLYFEGLFYDNVFCRRRGSGRAEAVIGTTEAAKDWAKHKFKFDFSGREFRYDQSQRRVEEINLQSYYQEPGEETYMRENLAFHIFNAVGVPAPLMKYIHVRVNNEFYGLFSFVEQVDSTFLKRNALDSDGPLYKAVNWKYSNLRAGDSSKRCPFATPDYPTEWMVNECPEIWRKASKENADKSDDLWDLTQMIDRVRRNVNDAYILYDVLALPEIINEWAAQTLVLSADRCTKNYFMHRDRGTGEWRRLPWDVEDAFPGDRRYGVELCNPNECSAKSTSYCILSCEKFNSPLYCDRNHPQDIFLGSGVQDPKSTYNVLVDVLLTLSPTKEMFLCRLRTIMDEILATDYIDNWVRANLDRIRNDALIDSDKWKVGGVRAIDQGVLQLLKQIVPKRREQLFKQYSGLIPPSTPPNARVYVAYAQKSSSDPSSQYIKLSNPNGFAIDISNWIVESQGWKYVIKPGTVLTAGYSMFIVRDVAKFRERATWARREYPQGLFIQGNLASDVPSDVASAYTVYKSQLERVQALSGAHMQRNITRVRPRIGFHNVSCVPPEIGEWSRFGDCCFDGECGLYCGAPMATRVRRRDVNVSLAAGIDGLCLVDNIEIDRKCALADCGEPEPPKACGVSQMVLSNVSRSVIFGSMGYNPSWENWSWDSNVTESGKGATILNVTLAPGGALAFQSARSTTRSLMTGLQFVIARFVAPQPLPRLVVQLELTISNATRIFSTDAVEFSSDALKSWNEGCFVEGSVSLADMSAADDAAPALFIDAFRAVDLTDPNLAVKIILRHEFYSALRFWLARVEVMFA